MNGKISAFEMKYEFSNKKYEGIVQVKAIFL
jgi:hypothetical protein